MDEQLDKLRSAGFSEADIAEYVEAQKGAPTTTTEVLDKSEIMIDETVPVLPAPPTINETNYKREDYRPPTSQIDSGTLGTLGALGAKVASDYWPHATGAVAAYKANQLINSLKTIAQARNVAPPPPTTVTPSAPVKPQVSSILGADGRPMPRTNVAPSKAAAQVAEAQAKARGAQISNFARKFALDKIMPGLASKALGPISAVAGMVMPSASESDYKYQFPITGPAKGSEINQQTGQPWTRQELDAYYTQFPEEPGMIDQATSWIGEQFSGNGPVKP